VLKIEENDSLDSLAGLDNLISIDEDLYVLENYSLTSLDGLNSITSVGGEIVISFNASLTSLDLTTLCAAGTDSFDSFRITYNAELCTNLAETLRDQVQACDGIRYLIKFVGTLENWWKEILNYFIERVSNGYVEGQNNAIRNIIRRAFGYRNFNNFRLQVFSELGSHTNPR
jgi:hypothetical protein